MMPSRLAPSRRCWYGLAVLLLSGLLLHGCAVFEPVIAPERQIERAAEQGDLQRALALIDQHDPQPHDAWEQRRAELEERAREAAADALRAARAASAEGAVARALEVLEGAEARLPADPERRRYMEQLEAQRQVGLQTLQQRHDILEAHALARQLRLLEVMRPLVSRGEQLPDDPDRLARRARELAATLDAHADAGDHAERLELLRLAQDLDPGPERSARITNLEQALRAEREPDDPEGQQARVNERLRTALAEDDLLAARQWCDAPVRIDPQAPDNEQTAQRTHQTLCAEWRERRDQQVTALLEQGRGLYTAGHIQEAVEIWEQGLALAPEHADLTSAHQRALRVLERLESLRMPAPAETALPEPLPETDAGTPAATP